MSRNPRLIFGAIFLACVGLVGFAMVLQHVKGLEPCPLCILQRYAFFLIALTALVGTIHGPGLTGQKIYAGVLALFALTGAGIASRHSYLQRFPDPSMSCGAGDFDYMMNTFPLAQALPKMFSGTGDCAKIQWSLFGLSIPEWALVWFLILGAATVWAVFRKR